MMILTNIKIWCCALAVLYFVLWLHVILCWSACDNYQKYCWGNKKKWIPFSKICIHKSCYCNEENDSQNVEILCTFQQSANLPIYVINLLFTNVKVIVIDALWLNVIGTGGLVYRKVSEKLVKAKINTNFCHIMLTSNAMNWNRKNDQQ